MSETSGSVQRRRILRLIRDLDLRYIRGAIDKRTYEILKNRYRQYLERIPKAVKEKGEEIKKDVIEETLLRVISESATKADKAVTKEELGIPSPKPKIEVELPELKLEGIPQIEIEELKIRYVMQLAIRAASYIFEQEMKLERLYRDGVIDEKEYLEKINLNEEKQARVFEHFYKLSDMLFQVTRKHFFKSVHSNFLLFNNELSENIARLREGRLDRIELKGIIYEINKRVSKHLPILKKAKEKTIEWKKIVEREKEKFERFFEENKELLTEKQKDRLKVILNQLSIYVKLLEEDIEDYETDIVALNEIYGEHLLFQEIKIPYFNNLTKETEEKLKRYSELIIASDSKYLIDVLHSKETHNISYQLSAELKKYWLYCGKPVVDKQGDLIGFLVGPGKFQEEFGIIIRKQQELSLSLIRRFYDYIVAPMRFVGGAQTEEEKKEFLLRDFIRTLPEVNHPYVTPDAIIEYCKRTDIELTNELKDLLKDQDVYLFAPISKVSVDNQKITVEEPAIVYEAKLLPFFDISKARELSKALEEIKEMHVLDKFGRKLGIAHSVIFHPNKGYFLAVKKEKLPTEFFAKLHSLIYGSDYSEFKENIDVLNEKKWELIFSLSREFNIPEGDVEDPEKLKDILLRKNAGILPNLIDKEMFVLFHLANVKIVGNEIKITYKAPSFKLEHIFDVENKVAENIKGKDIGLAYCVELNKKPVLVIWGLINLYIIASYVVDNPIDVLKEGKYKQFRNDLELSIATKLNISPYYAISPHVFFTFMNIIGKVNSLEEIKEALEKFKPIKLELERIISIEEKKILIDISDVEIEQRHEEERTREEISEETEEYFVPSPDYFLRQRDRT